MDFITLKQVSNNFKQELVSIYPPEEIKNFTWILFEHLLGFSKVDILMNEDKILDKNQQEFCKDALFQLKQHIPIQYIVGKEEFYGLKFKVNKHVLIPRPETEELVQWIIQNNHLESPCILDIGTGSGCIPIALKKSIPMANIMAWDISEDALSIAKENAITNNVVIEFLHQDALNPLLNKKFDIIVSNPPYVRESEKELMRDNVLLHEPDIALFVSNNDPLVFYREITKWAQKSLRKNGVLFFEINEYLAKETHALLSTYGFSDIVIKQDLFGKDRMIKGTLS